MAADDGSRPAADDISTAAAAALLRVSPQTVKRMTDNGLLACWRTPGGHRRIARASVQALLPPAAQPAAAVAAAGLLRPDIAERPAAGATAGGALHVLVVDDDAVTRLYVCRMLAKLLPQATVASAECGSAAVRYLDRHAVDVVVSDLGMPFDGFRLCWLLHVRAEYRGIACVVVSALREEEIRAKDGLPPHVLRLSKPPDMGRLVTHLLSLPGRQPG